MSAEEFDNAAKRVDDVARRLVAVALRQRRQLQQLQIAGDRPVHVDRGVEAQLGQLRGSYPTDQAFQQGIAAQGLTIEQVRQQARTNLLVQKVIDTEIASKVVVQDAEVGAFYQQNLERFKQGDSVHASHILIGLPQNPTVEQRTEAKSKAQAVLKQVRGGGDFAALARAESQDRGSAQNGGDLGFFSKGQMTPAFEEAAFATKPGTVSGIVETPFGFHIIKVQERRGPRPAPLTEVGGQIKTFLEQGRPQTEAVIDATPNSKPRSLIR